MARYDYANLCRTAYRAAARLRLGRQVAGTVVAGVLTASIAPASARDLNLARDLNEQVVQVPVRAMTERGPAEWELVASLYRPSGAGSRPSAPSRSGMVDAILSPGAEWSGPRNSTNVPRGIEDESSWRAAS